MNSKNTGSCRDIPSPDSQTGSLKSHSKKKTKSKTVFMWNVADVTRWLRKHCATYYGLYGNIFEEHEISGRALIKLNMTKLEQMGIQSQEHRAELLNLILKLRVKHEQVELKALLKGPSF